MTDKEFHSFYEDAVDASAAYLENENGVIIARCIIFNKVKDQYGKYWRLAERQYSTDLNDVLKRALVDALVKGGHIDGYKTVGAGCSDSCSFVDVEGNSLSNLRLSINCDLDWGDTLSYQDSFKNYCPDSRRATNYGDGYIQLDTTDGEINEDDDRPYDEYHDEYCDETRTVYRNGRELQCDVDRLDDFTWVDSEDAYYHYEDVSCCDHCEEYYLSENCYCSDITEGYYCCTSCMERAEDDYKENNWTWAEFDEEYYEDEDDVTTYQKWSAYSKTYDSCTINQETLDKLVEDGDYHLIGDIVYDEIDEDTELPYGAKQVLNSSTEQAA